MNGKIRKEDGGREEKSWWGKRMQLLCVYAREKETDKESGVPPAAVCRLGVHGGWAEWKAQSARREHLARHQLCTGHAHRPASTAQTHKHRRSKQRQTNTHQTHWQHVRGGAGGGTDIEEHWFIVSAAEPSYCSDIFNKGGEKIRGLQNGKY